MQDYAARQRSPQRHAVGIGLVLVLHLLLFWAIQSGLSREVTRKIQVVADVLLLTQEQPKLPEAPPPPPPKSLPSPPRGATPAVPTQAETPLPAAPSANTVIVAPSYSAPVGPVAPSAPATVAAPVATTAPGVRSEPVRTAAVVNSAQCEKPEYPSASRRLEEEGTVHLRFLVGVDGKVIQSEIEKSSGYRRLDEAARAGLGKCQFRPATVDGKPEQAWANMRYTWRLE